MTSPSEDRATIGDCACELDLPAGFTIEFDQPDQPPVRHRADCWYKAYSDSLDAVVHRLVFP